jgi:glyoxalase family protein
MVRILGLHHVTATVDDAQADIDFCTDALGLRLVKKTVNFDNHHVYHFYYGDAHGTPGTIWTTFPYRGYGVRRGTHGAGQITATSFSVPTASLDDWRRLLQDRGVVARDAAPRPGEEGLVFTDPSGLVFELIGNDADRRAPWTGGGVGSALAIRGLHSVTMAIAAPPRTIQFMTSMLGYEVAGRAGGRTGMAINGGGPGRTIDVVESGDAPQAVNGLGTVHHVAMAVETADDQLQMREALLSAGVNVTPVMDRCYFQSIYFREPGGVLFEIATMQPGFLVDEPETALGTTLKLPPWEERHRASIEAGLPEITVAAHARPAR